MLNIPATLRRALWLALVCALLAAPRAWASEPALTADFDGDGYRDHATLDVQEPSVVRVWLSATKATNLIRTAEPLVAIAAADLDGDRHPELITSNRSSGLQVWTKKKKHAGFRVFRLKHSRLAGVSQLDHQVPDPGPTLTVLETTVFRLFAPSFARSAYAVAPPDSIWIKAGRLARGPTSSPHIAPLAPRPPPVSVISS
jgi:hypothetical protein